MSVAAQVRGDFDALETAGGNVVVELDAWLAPQVAGDQLGDGLGDDQADGLVGMAADQGPERRLDPLEGTGDRLALGGADRDRDRRPTGGRP